VLMAITTSVSGARTPARTAVAMPTSITATISISAAISISPAVSIAISSERATVRYNVTRTTIQYWAQKGLLERSACGKRHRWYYRIPEGVDIIKGYGGPHAKPARAVPTPICHSYGHGAI
jgi:hypothetical protein